MVGPSRRARWGGLLAILVLSIISGGWLLRRKAAPDGNVYQQARLFENVVASIHDHYIDSLGEGDLYQTAAQALVASLHDPYAELLTRESYRQYQRQMSGTEVDVGLTSDNRLGIARAKLGPGDEILSIDGKSTRGWSARSWFGPRGRMSRWYAGSPEQWCTFPPHRPVSFSAAESATWSCGGSVTGRRASSARRSTGSWRKA